MGVMASQITSLTIVYSTVYSGADQRQERLKRRSTLGSLDQYAAQNNKYARTLTPSQPPTQKVFFQWHTQYDPTMKHSHCEAVYAKELLQWLLFELVHSRRILSILPTFKLASLTKNVNDVHKKLNFGLGLKLKIELKINFNQAQNW